MLFALVFPNFHSRVLALLAGMNYLLSNAIIVLLHLQGSRTRAGKQNTHTHTLYKEYQGHTEEKKILQEILFNFAEQSRNLRNEAVTSEQS